MDKLSRKFGSFFLNSRSQEKSNEKRFPNTNASPQEEIMRSLFRLRAISIDINKAFMRIASVAVPVIAAPILDSYFETDLSLLNEYINWYKGIFALYLGGAAGLQILKNTDNSKELKDIQEGIYNRLSAGQDVDLRFGTLRNDNSCVIYTPNPLLINEECAPAIYEELLSVSRHIHIYALRYMCKDITFHPAYINNVMTELLCDIKNQDSDSVNLASDLKYGNNSTRDNKSFYAPNDIITLNRTFISDMKAMWSETLHETFQEFRDEGIELFEQFE